MTNQELIERYTYAVVKQLPGRIREDVSRELQTLIDDMLESRCGEMPPAEKDLKVILTELGSPAELAQNYNPHKNSYLIGPNYFSSYKSLLVIILSAVAFGLIASGIASLVVDGLPAWSLIELLKWILSFFMSLVFGFAFVTILFAVFERKGIQVNFTDTTLDSLPPVPQKQEAVKKSDAVIAIIFSVLFSICFVLAPQILFFYSKQYGFIPIFDIAVIKNIWYLIIILSMLGIFKEVMKLHEGRYTKKLAVIVFITDIISFIIFILIIRIDGLINPKLISTINTIFSVEPDGDFIIKMFTNFNSLIFAVISFALLLDAGTAIVKALIYDK